MSGEDRRKTITDYIEKCGKPVPAKDLASMCGVSRQVIVQDVALIRASGIDILSTNRGYIILDAPSECERVFRVKHTDEQMWDELAAIVDRGGKVENVMVDHDIYGRISAVLEISSRKDITEFLDKLKNSSSAPLKNTTSDYHYHTVTASDEDTLDAIEAVLDEKGMLVK